MKTTGDLETINAGLRQQVEEKTQAIQEGLNKSEHSMLEKKAEAFRYYATNPTKWHPVDMENTVFSGDIYFGHQFCFLVDADVTYKELTDTNTPGQYRLKVRTQGPALYDPKFILQEFYTLQKFREYGVKRKDYKVVSQHVEKLVEEGTNIVLSHYYVYVLKINRNIFENIYRQKFVAVNKDGGVYDNGYIELEQKYAKDYPEGAITRLNIQDSNEADRSPEELLKIANACGEVVEFKKTGELPFIHYTIYLKPL